MNPPLLAARYALRRERTGIGLALWCLDCEQSDAPIGDGARLLELPAHGPQLTDWDFTRFHAAAREHDAYHRVVAAIVMPHADWLGAWAQLRGYVQDAADDRGPFSALELLKYMDELKAQATRPVSEWIRAVSDTADTGNATPGRRHNQEGITP